MARPEAETRTGPAGPARPAPSLTGRLLRARIVLRLVLLGLPLLLLCVLGLLWLHERDWLLHFLAITTATLLLFRLGFWAMARRTHPAQPEQDVPPLLAPDPEWRASEQAVFAQLQAHIAQRLPEPVPWADLQPLAFELLQQTASLLSGGKRKALDFSLPEALLLVDRVAVRLRGVLREHLPLADTVRLETLVWLWAQRRQLGLAARLGQGLWRVGRALSNPPAAMAKEVQNLILGEATQTLQAHGELTAQRLILEEVARAAVELHSGQLRFSDAELLDIELASARTDAAARTAPDQPLRVLVLGQVSAGKTSLINALLGEQRGETDLAPTTPGLASHAWTVDGIDFTLVDSPGLDGSDASAQTVLEQMLQADLLLWAVRANRPAQAVDAALLQTFRAALANQPQRRAPRILLALTATDQLLPGWPFVEHALPVEAQARVAELLHGVASELQEKHLLAVCTTPPSWNIDTLARLIAHEAGEALMVQRNRRRLQGQDRQRGARAELKRAGKGLAQLARLAGRQLRSGPD